MRNSLMILSFVALLSLISCEKEKSFEEKYVGAWDMTFEGSYSGEETVIVKSDGTFSFEVILSQSIFGTLRNTLTGSVLDNGVIEGDVIMNGDDIGDFTGQLEGNSMGEGIYQTNIPTSGTWVAVKK